MTREIAKRDRPSDLYFIAQCEGEAASVLANLPRVTTLEEAEDIHKRLGVIEEMAKRAKNQMAAQNKIARARIHTEAKLGQLSQSVRKFPGKRRDQGQAGETPLQSLGYSKAHIQTFRSIYNTPPEIRDEYMDAQEEAEEAISSRGVLNYARKVHHDKRVNEIVKEAQDASAPLDGVVLLGRMQDQLSVVKDESVDLVVTDPPYGMGKNAEIGFAPLQRGQKATQKREEMSKTAGAWDDMTIHQEFRSWISILSRLLRPTGSIYIFVADMHIGRMWDALETYNLKVRNLLTWQKLNPPPMVRKRHWGWASEHLLFATKSDNYTFNWLTHHEMHNVIQCAICGGNERLDHPTQKPVRLLKRIIQVSSNPGDTVLDPFAGVGSTGQAARDLERQYIMVEEDENYYKRACLRLSRPVGKTAKVF